MLTLYYKLCITFIIAFRCSLIPVIIPSDCLVPFHHVDWRMNFACVLSSRSSPCLPLFHSLPRWPFSPLNPPPSTYHHYYLSLPPLPPPLSGEEGQRALPYPFVAEPESHSPCKQTSSSFALFLFIMPSSSLIPIKVPLAQASRSNTHRDSEDRGERESSLFPSPFLLLPLPLSLSLFLNIPLAWICPTP